MPFFLRFPGREFKIAGGESIIGREKGCRFWIDDVSVSRRHARLLYVGEVLTIEDLGSKNGIKLNGKRVTGAVPLSDGDLVALGQREVMIRRQTGFDTSVGEETGPYQLPIMRTCVACRNMIEAHEERCKKCGAEAFSVGEGDTRTGFNDMSALGNPSRASIRIRALYVSPQTTIEGELLDVSFAGGFFATAITDRVGTYCDLVLQIGDGEKPIKIDAEVVSNPTAGMGLKFLRLSRSAQDWLLRAKAQPA